MLACPLCHHSKTQFYFEDKKRRYQQCDNCQLVFVDPKYFLSLDDEKREYDLHENNLSDPGYVRFLSKLAVPLCERLNEPASGLDFGCGPAPALANILQEAGHKVALYDKFYATDKAVLASQYDFITCTEVVEHLHTPATEWHLLMAMLKPGGTLGIMTKLLINKQRFAQWHYKNDPTHVAFFSQATFEFLAQQYNLNCTFVGSDVILLKSS